MTETAMQRTLWTTAVAATLILTVVGPNLQQVQAHRMPEAAIYSRFVQTAMTIDGDITAAEWQNAMAVDLSTIPFNTVNAYLLVQNNGTMLRVAYDVISDVTEGANDSAGLAFDGDHDGVPTPQGDGEYSVRASNDSACLPFRTKTCHYVYSGLGGAWAPEDAMDQMLPLHAGLAAAMGFGPSQRSATPHRTYEFSIPLALIGKPTAAVGPGDIVGLFASRHTTPFVGVWDGDISTTASWPDNSPMGPNGYGHLYLAAPNGAALSPDYSFKPASPSQPAVHSMSLRNIGANADSYDVIAESGAGWTVELRDNLGTILTDHGGNASLPDLGPIPSGTSANLFVTVIPLMSASPGTVDIIQLIVSPWSDANNLATSILRSVVPLPTPWSDNLEAGSSNWTIPPGSKNDWELGVPNATFPLGPTAAHSGSNVWGTNLTGNHSLSSLSILETTQIRIPDFVASAHLTFWQWYRIIGPYGDGGWVEASVDGGEWSGISPEGGYPAQRFGGEPAYCGASVIWVLADFNLTSFAGKSIAFRFIFWDWFANGESAGWYIDDVAVQVSLAAAGLRMTPTSSFMVGSKLDVLRVGIRIQNIGISEDVFDLSFSQVLGWQTQFLDQFGVPLDDTERPRDGFVDTGPVPSGGYVNITLSVNVSASATPGDIESVTAVFRSSVDIQIAASGQYKFQLAVPIPFFDDMESGQARWVTDAGSLWHQVDSCQPSPPPWHISYSPCHSWWYGQDIKGTYATGSRTYGNLTSPPMELFGVPAAHLSFRQWYETEPTIQYDQRWILIRTDNNPWPGKGQAGSVQMGLFFEKTWLQGSVDLSPFIGHIVQVRFFFDSIDGQNNNHQGWYIDDVNVSEYTPGSTPPNIALTRPVLGDRWSAGVPQAISWQASDDADPPSMLRVWVNYSYTGSTPWSPVPSAQAVRGDLPSVMWTPPCANITGAAINATAADTFGLLSWTGPVKFDLDCRMPTVISGLPRNPPDVSVKANVSVTFSEQMNVTATQAAFSLRIVQGWVQVPGSFAWIGNTMYFVPTDDLRASTLYQVNVTTSAKDVSDPGNRLATLYTWQFMTSTHADSPPDIIIFAPLGGEDWSGSTSGRTLYRTVSWTVTDDFDNQLELKVWVNYTADGGGAWTSIGLPQPFNGTMSELAWKVPCINTTQAAVGIAAFDAGRKSRSVASPFFKIDCAPPEIVTFDPTGNLVQPTAVVRVAFSESMNQPLTQGALSIWKKSDWTQVAGIYSWAGFVMTFRPALDLDRGSKYQVNVSTEATDSSNPGNKLATELSWEIVIAAAPPPRVSSTDPTNGTKDVPVNTRIITVTLTPDTTAFVGAVNITPYVNFSMESPVGSSLIIIRIWQTLRLGTLYRVTLNASLIVDTANNHLDGDSDGVGGDDYSFFFTTASSQSTENTELPAWVWAIPLAVIGFVIPLAAYAWRRKRRDERRRKRRESKATRTYRDTIGPERRAAGEPEAPGDAEVTDSSSRPPF